MPLQKIVKNGTETGATLADKINALIDVANLYTIKVDDVEAAVADLPALETSVADNTADIATNASNIAANTSDISANTADLSVLNETGLLSLKRTTTGVLPLTTSYQTIPFAETLNIDASNGCFSYNSTAHQLTVLKDGVYFLNANGSISGSNGTVFFFSYFLNGVELVPGAAASFTTLGAGSPIAVGDARYIELSVNDIVDIRAKRSGSGDLTILSSSLAIEKTQF